MKNGPTVRELADLMLAEGRITRDFYDDLWLQKSIFDQHRNEWLNVYPGKVLAVVEGGLLIDESYFTMLERLYGQYPGKPFCIHVPPPTHAVHK